MKLASLLAVAAFLAPQQSEGPSPEALDAVGKSFKDVSQGLYLPAVSRLESLYQKGSEADKSVIGELLGTFYSYVGEYQETDRMADGPVEAGETNEPPTTSPLSDAVAEDAVKAIVREAKSHQIVFLNEAHHEPRSRAFALQVARALRKEGFEYFAAETFIAKVHDAAKAGYPMRGIGMYTAEPVFGDLARQVIKLGYKPMEYEADMKDSPKDQMERINFREIHEAENLQNNILKAHPKAKILIYCGYSHATENWQTLPEGKELAWMAARLKKATGIDPLTIDQTGEMPHSRVGAETPEYRYATAHGLVPKPTVFRSKSGQWLVFGPQWQGRVDMQVFHPRDTQIQGRPSWLSIDGYRRPLSIRNAATQTGRYLLQAFVADEPEDAIPMDQIIVEPGKPTPALMLPKGHYRIVAQDESGKSTVLWKDQRA